MSYDVFNTRFNLLGSFYKLISKLPYEVMVKAEVSSVDNQGDDAAYTVYNRVLLPVTVTPEELYGVYKNEINQPVVVNPETESTDRSPMRAVYIASMSVSKPGKTAHQLLNRL